MGTGPSSLGGTLSREKLLEGTKVTRQIVDIIFEYLMENIKLRDFYSLSSPDKCKRYVLFTANTLYTKFIQIQIEPQKGKDGTIWFRSVSDLTNPPKATMGTAPEKDESLQQQRLCLQLAYFYVRILQIYGALALTLIDDSKFMVEQGYTRGFLSGATIEQPGKTPYYATTPKKEYILGPQKRMTGGGLYDVNRYKPISINEIRGLELFRCLHIILYVTPGEYNMRDRGQKSYWIKFIHKPKDLKSEGPGTILTIEPLEKDGDKKIQHGKLIMESGRNKATIYVTSKPEYDSAGQIKSIYMEFNPNVRVRIEGHDETLYNFLDKDIPHNFTFTPEGYQKVGEYDIQLWKMFVNRAKKSIEEGMQEFILDVWDKIKQNIKPGLIDTDQKILKTEAISELTPTLFQEDRDVSKHLRIQPIIDGMTRKRRFGHCVGRALQLLTTIPSLSGLKDTTFKATSSICDLKFSKDYVDTPTGISLSETASISSLANLFYDTVTMGDRRPDLTIGGESINEYVTFIKQMSELFMDKTFGDADIKSKPDEALKSITVKDSPVCTKDNRKMLLDSNFAMTYIYPQVQELFRTQLVHAANCAKIFAQLFDIRKEGTQYKVRINPTVISRGISEVDRIAKITRNILVQYYSNCETTYLKGVMNIENAVRNKDPAVEIAGKSTVGNYGDESKPKYVFEKDKDEEYLKSRYTSDDIRRRRYVDDNNDDRYYRERERYRERYRYGGRLTMTRKRKSK